MLGWPLPNQMESNTEHIRKIGRSVQDARRVNREIGSICGEIDALLEESKAAKAKARRKRSEADEKARKKTKE